MTHEVHHWIKFKFKRYVPTGAAVDMAHPASYFWFILRAGRNSPPAVKARERCSSEQVSRSGEIPGPTVKVRMVENGTNGAGPARF